MEEDERRSGRGETRASRKRKNPHLTQSQDENAPNALLTLSEGVDTRMPAQDARTPSMHSLLNVAYAPHTQKGIQEIQSSVV
jgi:hypothetical protein